LCYISPSCERITGYRPEEFIEKPSLYTDIILPEDQDIWKEHHQRVHRPEGGGYCQFRIHSRNKEVRWIEHACQSVYDHKGQYLGQRASNRDITARKLGELKLREALSEIEQLKNQLEADSAYLREEIKLYYNFENIIGRSDMLKYVLFKVEQVAATDATVMILGETGTGKELIARAIHAASSRKERPLIKVNCATLPANLIESELFGHEKGAFTGADHRLIGRFDVANGATLFLDEVGELPLELQPKLLRVIEHGEFERLGSTKTLKTDVRIIAASNRDLEEEVEKGRFRKDLWFRLNIFPITVPPLRQRIDDIPLLVENFLDKYSRKHGRKIHAVSKQTMNRLQGYSWPGNVRELENLIERAVIGTSGTKLQVVVPTDNESTDIPISDADQTLEEMERKYILKVVEKTRWRIEGPQGAARILGLNPSTLRSRMQKLGIQRPI
jgi:chemotaxis protein methyltransferase CheR